MAPEQLSPLDATFLHVEDHVSHMHVGSVLVVDGPAPPYADMVALISSRLFQVPRYRQHVRFPPLNLGTPVWVDDPHFNIEYHVRHTALPSPGGDEQLRHLVERLMSQPLDRDRPLWEVWIVEGLPEGRWAMVNKNHHATIDGVAGVELLGLILDPFPRDEPAPAPEWTPEPAPSSFDLAVGAIAAAARRPWRFRAVAPKKALTAGWSAAARTLPVLRGLPALAGAVRPTADTSLNGPLGPHRRYAWTELPVDDVKRIRKAHGGTFNDVVLALITRGFRDLLQSRGEAAATLRTMVPVSIRPRDSAGLAVGDGRLANHITAMFAELPVGIDDPVERLHTVTGQMEHVKESGQAVAAAALTDLATFTPPLLLALSSRLATKVAQKSVNTVTTNVPGPQVPLYALGRRVRKLYPYVPLAGQVRVGVAIFSYDGLVTFGVSGDYDSAPDLDVLTSGINAEAAALLA